MSARLEAVKQLRRREMLNSAYSLVDTGIKRSYHAHALRTGVKKA